MTLIVPLAQTLRDCLQEALDARLNPLPQERVQIRFGAELFPDRATGVDECCPGIAWVRPVEAAPRFTIDDDQGVCVASLRRSLLEMSVYRCMPTPAPDSLVTRDQWERVFLQAESDHSAMEAAACCFTEVLFGPVVTIPGVHAVFVSDWVPVGPDANCVGSTLQILIEHGCACGTEG